MELNIFSAWPNNKYIYIYKIHMNLFINFLQLKPIGSLILLVVVSILVTSCGSTNNLTLAKGGKANYLIVLPDSPTLVEKTAAKELKKHMEQITGAEFTVIGESEVNSEEPMLVVGNSNLARTLLPAVNLDNLAYDGIIIETVGRNVVLLGHPVRGTLYAVNTFLEEATGVRWWTSTEAHIPSSKNLQIPQLHVNYAPHLIYRESFYKDALSNSPFAVRMKSNGDFSKIEPEYGGYHRFQYFVHSFYPILPPQVYFEKHPEWYSLVDGKRLNQWAQLCLSNEEMLKEFTKNVLDTLRSNPDRDFISISQNDCHGACQCDKCQAIVKEEGSESGPLIRFVNAVAEEIEKEFPNIWVETLAYQYTRKAPLKAVPRKNVVIRLCTIECSFSQPLGEGDHNQPLRDDIEAWSSIATNLFVWNYVTNFTSYMLPHPNLHTLAPDIRFLIKNKTIGLFEQGDFYCDAGDFVRMRNWVISRLMWNHKLDENQLIDEFLAGYYGKEAAPYLRRYWDLLTQQVKDADAYLRCYMEHTADWLTVPVYAEAASLMKQALNATKEEVYRNRLRREEIPLKFVLLLENERFKSYEKENGGSPVVLPDPEKGLEEFMSLLDEFNVTMVREDFSNNANHRQWIEQVLNDRLFPKGEKQY